MHWIHGESDHKPQNGDVRSHMHLRGGSGEERSYTDFTRQAEDKADSHLGRMRLAVSGDFRPVALIRRNPLAAVGFGATIGFLLGLASETPERHWAVERARRRLRGAILGGISALVLEELRSAFEEHEGIATLLAPFFGDEDDADLSEV